jgi:redox-sensing transcriptional repressor
MEQGQDKVSSNVLGETVGVKPSQVRKDFSYFGEFGKPGVGYSTSSLIRQIKKILQFETVQKAALVGVGNLGSAVLSYPGFGMFGLEIVAAFDSDPKKIGKKVSGVVVEGVGDLGSLGERGVRLGIVAVPSGAAQETVDLLVDAGVRGILNFSPCNVVAPKKVKVATLDIAMELARLPYYVPVDRGEGNGK